MEEKRKLTPEEIKKATERIESLRQHVLRLITDNPEFNQMMPSEQMAALNMVAGDVVYSISKATNPDNLEKMLMEGAVVWAKNMLVHMAFLSKKDEMQSPFAKAVAAFQASMKGD
jgi:spermidine/putrescine-binding protein